MAVLAQRLAKRDHQDDITMYEDPPRSYNNWYLSDEASNIKYAVLSGILLSAFIIILGMWFHATSRLKKGIAPLPYHRWLIPRAQREPELQQPEQQFSFYQNQQNGAYNMHTVPPPAYNPNYAQPPIYSGGVPTDTAKVDPFLDHSEHPANFSSAGPSGSGPAPLPPVAAPPTYHHHAPAYQHPTQPQNP